MVHNPPHPGELLRDEVIAELGLSVTEAAERLAMSRVAMSRVLNGKAAISPILQCGSNRREPARPAHGSPCRRIMICGARCSTSSRPFGD